MEGGGRETSQSYGQRGGALGGARVVEGARNGGGGARNQEGHTRSRGHDDGDRGSDWGGGNFGSARSRPSGSGGTSRSFSGASAASSAAAGGKRNTRSSSPSAEAVRGGGDVEDCGETKTPNGCSIGRWRLRLDECPACAQTCGGLHGDGCFKICMWKTKAYRDMDPAFRRFMFPGIDFDETEGLHLNQVYFKRFSEWVQTKRASGRQLAKPSADLSGASGCSLRSNEVR